MAILWERRIEFVIIEFKNGTSRQTWTSDFLHERHRHPGRGRGGSDDWLSPRRLEIRRGSRRSARDRRRHRSNRIGRGSWRRSRLWSNRGCGGCCRKRIGRCARRCRMGPRSGWRIRECVGWNAGGYGLRRPTRYFAKRRDSSKWGQRPDFLRDRCRSCRRHECVRRDSAAASELAGFAWSDDNSRQRRRHRVRDCIRRRAAIRRRWER